MPRSIRVLLLERDDLPGDPALAQSLDSQGSTHQRVAAPGWNGMMADHQFTVVPDDALATIREWLLSQTPQPPQPGPGTGQAPVRCGTGEYFTGPGGCASVPCRS